MFVVRWCGGVREGAMRLRRRLLRYKRPGSNEYRRYNFPAVPSDVEPQRPHFVPDRKDCSPSIAARLKAQETAVRVAAHRFRLRYRDLIRAEIADTVTGPGEVDAELARLFAALGS